MIAGLLWLGASIFVGNAAGKRGRSGVIWGLLAFIFSPLIVGVALLLMDDLSRRY